MGPLGIPIQPVEKLLLLLDGVGLIGLGPAQGAVLVVDFLEPGIGNGAFVAWSAVYTRLG